MIFDTMFDTMNEELSKRDQELLLKFKFMVAGAMFGVAGAWRDKGCIDESTIPDIVDSLGKHFETELINTK